MMDLDLEKVKKLSAAAYNFLDGFDPCEYEDGRHEICDGVYVNIETYVTYPREERKFESHEKYIDIQYMISGREIVTAAPVSDLEVCDPYDEERDISFYFNCLKGTDMLLNEGDFLIFKPGTAHMPCICIDKRESVRKAVIKVPV